MVDNCRDDYNVNPDLFEKEMKYVFENGYKFFK